MNILDKMQSQSQSNDTRANVAISVSGYHIDKNNPDNNRIIGHRIDTKELVEVHVSNISNPQQPTVNNIRSNVATSGTVILGAAYINQKLQKQSDQSSYILTCRWPRMLSPSKNEGRTVIVNAKVQTPFIQDDGRATMNVFIQGTNPVQIENIDEFDNHFFSMLNPSNAALKATPYAGVRVFKIGPNGEKLDGRLQQFSPAFTSEYKPENIQNTFNEYQTKNSNLNKYFTAIKETVTAALSDPNHTVELVPISKFIVGTQTKVGIVNKMEKSLPTSTWEVVPTRMEDQDGFTKCIVGLRKFKDSDAYYVCGAMPTEIAPVITATGIETIADKARRSQSSVAQEAQQPEQPAQQAQPLVQQFQQPAQQTQPQRQKVHQPAQQTPEQPFSNQQEATQQTRSRYQQFQQQAPEDFLSQEEPTMEAYETYIQQSSIQQEEPPVYQEELPDQNYQQGGSSKHNFFIIDQNEHKQLTIVPPSANIQLENSVYKSLSAMVRASQNNGTWVFQMKDKEAVTQKLTEVLEFSSRKHPEIGAIKNNLTEQLTNNNDAQFAGLDFEALSNEIDSMFDVNPNNNMNM